MPIKKSNSLTAAFVRVVTTHGAYSDGNGSTLRADKSGRRWVLRVTIDGKRRNIGLSSYRLVSLSEGRDAALANALAIRDSRDPVLEKRQAREELRSLEKPTFSVSAETVIEMRRPTWRNAKHSSTSIAPGYAPSPAPPAMLRWRRNGRTVDG